MTDPTLLDALAEADAERDAAFDRLPSGAVTDETESVLKLVDGDPIHASDRAVIVAAILADAEVHDGRIDPNRVRANVGNVYPRCIGATYQSLRKAGVIETDGWVVNTDAKGRNAGRPARAYRLTSKET